MHRAVRRLSLALLGAHRRPDRRSDGLNPGKRSRAGRLAPALVAILAGQCLAQDGGAAGRPDLSDDPVAIAATDHASRAVLVDLRLSDSPTPEDYEIGAMLFSIVAELAPGDAELARLETAAAFGTGDPGLLERATSRVVSLDPRDTVAQLRLITARIGQKQTSEERLAIYSRLLGPKGVSLDPSVRSRLALDAALIHRESGDLDGFLEKLTLATELDQTNKEAQHLATSYYSEYAGGGPQGLAGLLEMQLRLLYADPIDPNIHFSLSRMLAVEGATAEAVRFYENGISILTRAGQLEPRHRVEALGLQWLLEGPRVVLETIDYELRLARNNASILYERQREQDIPDRLLTPPEEVFLDPMYEKIRIIAAMDAQDNTALQKGLAEIDAYMRHQFAELEEATRLDDQVTRQNAFKEFGRSLISLQFMRALANADIRTLAAQLPEIPRYIGEQEWARLGRPLEAWVALRSGDLEKARAILEEIGTPDSIMRVCYAELLAAEGKSREAAEQFERVMRIDPFIPYGAWARSRAMELAGRTDPVTEAGRIMQRMVAEVPRALDALTVDPSAVMSLNIEPSRRGFAAGERVVLSVSVTNLTPWPLSLGPNRTISSRILVGVSADNFEDFPSQPQPVVADLDRRLRLGPTETLRIEVPVERGLNGIIFDSAERGAVRQLWQGWQAPTLDGTGAYAAGPYSLSDSTVKFVRSTRDTSRLPAAELAALVRDASEPDSVVEAIESAAARLWREGRDPGGLVAAFTERYERAGPVERVLLVSALPGAVQVEDMEPFDLAVRTDAGREAVRRVDTPRLLAAMILLTRVGDAGDPLLASAEGSADPELARYARLLRTRLGSGRAAYATSGPGIDGLSGASKIRAIKGETDQ